MSNFEKKKGLEKTKNQYAAILLGEKMHGLSEGYYCASWLMDLEYTLYGMLQGADRDFGFDQVSEEEINRLSTLATDAGGWWMWNEVEHDEVFVTTAEWEKIYEERQHIPG